MTLKKRRLIRDWAHFTEENTKVPKSQGYCSELCEGVGQTEIFHGQPGCSQESFCPGFRESGVISSLVGSHGRLSFLFWFQGCLVSTSLLDPMLAPGNHCRLIAHEVTPRQNVKRYNLTCSSWRACIRVGTLKPFTSVSQSLS